MKRFLFQTARPITLLAWIPPFVGSLLAGSLGLHTLTACIGAIVAIGLINIHNNQVDRGIDRHNPAKDTLALLKPLKNHELVMVVAVVVGLFLRSTGYDYLLLSILFYTGIFYNYVLGRVPILKRLVVAVVVGATSLLAVTVPNVWVYLWATAVGGFIFYRETNKDRADAQEDNMARFFKLNATVDYWCIAAPIVGILIYLGATLALGVTLGAINFVLSLGQALTIFSFMQIRARHGWYRMRFPHRLIAGQAGLVLALAGLMPPFAENILPIVVFNMVTIYIRSCLPAKANISWWANLHDGYLWASLIWLAMLGPSVFSHSAVALSFIVLVTVFVWEYRRTRRLQAT